ncbi:MAG: hypothetical protein AAF661_15095 [Pseudomonadota bacterium]
MNLGQTFFDILDADQTVSDWVARFDWKSATYKAIFPAEPPQAVLTPFPCVIAASNVAGSTRHGINFQRVEMVRQVELFAHISNRASEIDAMAEHVWGLFFQPAVSTIGDWTVVVIEPTGGITTAPTDETLRGRLISVRVALQKDNG